MNKYTVRRQYEGLYYIFDWEGDRVASVAKFLPGPMVSYSGPKITSPAMARAVARAMNRLAKDIEASS